MQQNNQELDPYQTDEIDVKKFFNSLLARKLFILGLTGLVTLLTIIYALNLTPTYKATSSFTAPNDSSVALINSYFFSEELNYKSFSTFESNNMIFSNFLTMLSSREFQLKVFLDGDYLTDLNPENEPINDVKDYALGFLRSISIEDIGTGLDFLDVPFSISIEGGNSEIISRYLNALVIAADNETIKQIFNLQQNQINIRLKHLAIDRKLMIAKAKQVRLNEIVALTSAAKIANSLGIVENNFDRDALDTNLIIAIDEKKVLPEWYLYGEKAILERINILKNRVSDDAYIPEILILDNEILNLESVVLDSSGVNSMQINQTAIITIVNQKKRQMVLIAFFAGFMISILLSLAMDALKPDEKNSA